MTLHLVHGLSYWKNKEKAVQDMTGTKKRLKKMINDCFGKSPLDGHPYYNAGQRLDDVRRLHKTSKGTSEQNWEVDEITWNDLDMDQIFLRINHTNSFIGEQMLYQRLHLLEKGKNEEQTRQFESRLFYLKENPKVRLDIEAQLNRIGKHEGGYYLSEFLLNTDLWKIGNTRLYHMLQVLLTVFLIGAFVFENGIAAVGLAGIVLTNLLIYVYSKLKYEIYLSSLADFRSIYRFAK